MLLHVTFKSLWGICNFKNVVSPLLWSVWASRVQRTSAMHAVTVTGVPTSLQCKLDLRYTLDGPGPGPRAGTWRYRYIRNAECWCFYNMCLHTEEKPLVECVHKIFKLVFTMCWQHSANWGGGGSDGEESTILSWGLLVVFSPSSLYSQFNPLLSLSFLK